MSSTTWTARAVASSAAAFEGELWRAVEAQHVVATTALVDTLDEQHTLERLLEEGKPAIPLAARRLHWLLFTPFRYPPPPRGSRFRGPADPGVFYGADEIRTACAELGYWRWRHLQDSPALAAMPTKPQTLFRSRVAATCVDLRKPPFVRDRAAWTRPDDYADCHAAAGNSNSASRSTPVRCQTTRSRETESIHVCCSSGARRANAAGDSTALHVPARGSRTDS